MRNEYSGEECEFVPGVLRGYRQMLIGPGPDSKLSKFSSNVTSRSLRVISPQRTHIWGPGWNVADCFSVRKVVADYYRINGQDVPLSLTHDIIPDFDCVCGFYAAYTYDWLLRAPGLQWLWNNSASVAVAAVEAKGRVIVGTQGFRAEQMRVLGLAQWPKSLVKVPPDTEIQGFRILYSVSALLEQYPSDNSWADRMSEHRRPPRKGVA